MRRGLTAAHWFVLSWGVTCVRPFSGVSVPAILCGWLLCVLLCAAAAANPEAAKPNEDRAFELYQAAAEDFKVRDFAGAVEKLESAARR